MLSRNLIFELLQAFLPTDSNLSFWILHCRRNNCSTIPIRLCTGG